MFKEIIINDWKLFFCCLFFSVFFGVLIQKLIDYKIIKIQFKRKNFIPDLERPFFDIPKDIESFNGILGVGEIIYYFIAFFTGKLELIAWWLVFKEASKWQTWNTIVKVPEAISETDPLDYLRQKNYIATYTLAKWFLRNLVNILAGFLGALVFSIIGVGFQSNSIVTQSIFIDWIFDNLINLVVAGGTLAMFWATKESAKATKQIADDAKKSRRPYLVFEKAEASLGNYFYKKVNVEQVTFPYVLKNQGDVGAKEIHKNHIVIRKKEGKDELVEYYKEGKNFVFSLVPGDISITHMDDLNLKKAKEGSIDFLVEFYIDYKSDIPDDDRQFTSIIKFKLKSEGINNNQYVFVNQPTIIPFKNERMNQPFESKKFFIEMNKYIDCCDE